LSLSVCSAVFRRSVFPPNGLALSGKAFVAMDRLLDRSASGPLHLRRREIAELMIGALQDGQDKFQRYQLHAFVVMPNHVHLLVSLRVMASRWLAPLKGFTAYRANELLGSHGQSFWQDETHDQWYDLRESSTAFALTSNRTQRLRVSVVDAPEYPWSSAASRLKGGCGQDWPPHIL
jgi:REP element-mobilizing transposase RayT